MNMKAASRQSTFLCLLLMNISTGVDSDSVTILNDLGDDVFITCYSRDNTIASNRALHAAEKLHWKFGSRFTGATLFSCHAVHGDRHVCWQAYNQDTVSEYCLSHDVALIDIYDCSWNIEEHSVTYEIRGAVKAIADWGGPC